MDLKSFEYELVIQAFNLQDDSADEVFKVLIQIAECSTYIAEYIKDWDILFSNLAFIADYIKKNGYSIYDEIPFASAKNTLAELFVHIVLNNILLSNKTQQKAKNETLYCNLGTKNNWRPFSRF